MSIFSGIVKGFHDVSALAAIPADMAADFVMGGVLGDKAVKNQQEMQDQGNQGLNEIGGKTGLKDMYEGAGDLPIVGGAVKAPSAIDKLGMGATKAGAWFHNLF